MMTIVNTRNKSIRFLLACLLYKAKPKRPWILSVKSIEAHYLKLLYNKEITDRLVHDLFSLTISPLMVDDCCHYLHIFDSYSYLGNPILDPQPVKEFEFELNLESLRFISAYDLDLLLGWPRGLAHMFFNYMYSKPLPNSLEDLSAGLGFRKIAKHEISNPFEIRFDIPKKPKSCPFCGSKDIGDVIVGMPDFSGLKGNELIYGCCFDPDCPPPNWHCNHCGLPFWKNRESYWARSSLIW